MDSTDYQILSCLKENSRENATNIGAKINLSTSAVIERIKKLENSGIIEKYTTIINQSALGRELTAFIYVSLEHPKYNEEFIRLINENSSVVECHYIAGDFDFILKVVTKSGRTLEGVLNFVKSIGGVSLTRTSVVLSTNKCEVSLLPDKEKDDTDTI
ncbi:MAG: Lrp/AsnC family transcriptional regulator [Ruminococcaceae bacterium]|nr:Lrp/AsnC family transcriptional regulator [Oscillospiraceae bacterium]